MLQFSGRTLTSLHSNYALQAAKLMLKAASIGSAEQENRRLYEEL